MLSFGRIPQLILSKKINRNKALGVFSTLSGTALAVIEGALENCPRITICEYLQPETKISEYVNIHALRKSVCVDVLPFSDYSLLKVDLQGVSDDEKREAARWQIRELIDYPAEDAVLDIVDVPIVGEEAKTRTFVVAAPMTALKLRASELVAADLHLDAIDIPELALRNLLELYQDEPRGHCLLWLREKSGLLIICRGETFFFSRTINVGMEHFKSADMTGGDGLLSENTQSLLDGIVLEVQRSFDYCESNFRLPPVPTAVS